MAEITLSLIFSNLSFKLLSDNDANFLEAFFSEEEVIKVIWDCEKFQKSESR